MRSPVGKMQLLVARFFINQSIGELFSLCIVKKALQIEELKQMARKNFIEIAMFFGSSLISMMTMVVV